MTVKKLAKSETLVRLIRGGFMFIDARLNQFIIIGFIAALLIVFLDGLRKSTNRKEYLIGMIQTLGIIIVVGFVIPWTIWTFLSRQ
jgi:hypothetical protein